VPEFLVELYVSRTDPAAAERAAGRAGAAAEELTREGTTVRFLRAIFVPEEETCLLLYEAASVDDVRKAAERASLSFEHVAEASALSMTKGGQDG